MLKRELNPFYDADRQKLYDLGSLEHWDKVCCECNATARFLTLENAYCEKCYEESFPVKSI